MTDNDDDARIAEIRAQSAEFAKAVQLLVIRLDAATKRAERAEKGLRDVINEPLTASYQENGEPGGISPDDDWSFGHLAGLKDSAEIARKALDAKESTDG